AQMEGCLRNLGVHACGVIITPGELTNYVPVTKQKDGNMLLTQYDNSVAESAGLLKMDFLGLKTLTIIRDALKFIEQRHGVKIDIDAIPLDDPKTYEIFQKGETNGIFQFESDGMKKYLKELKPDTLSDLIAMNALYRPGPLQYIPKFILRKHGLEPVTYDLPAMEEFLKETYGITVYQEQVMLLAQKLAGFSKGDADTLRKAMGKKQKDTLDKMKDKFMKGCAANGHPVDVCDKIWKDWEAFASYAFNKSHSTCYAYLAYQTAYLKAHYPSEFLASVLNHQKDISKISFFLEECHRLGIKVLGPDINESYSKFMVMSDGSIRFGLSGIKGVGENIVELIVHEREKNGKYLSIFDFARRHDTKVVNKKVIENLAQAGAFDSFDGIKRSMFFMSEDEGKPNLTDILIKYCNQYQKSKNSSSQSLFGGSDQTSVISEPELPKVEEWSMTEKLKKEKELVGFYLSGHPLNPWNWMIRHVCNVNISDLKNRKEDFLNKEVHLAAIVENAELKYNKSGNPFSIVELSDKSGETLELIVTGKECLQYQHYLKPDIKLFLKLKVIPSYDGTAIRINLSEASLLEDQKNKIRKHFKINIPLELMNEETTKKIQHIIKKYPGENTYEICLIDRISKREFHLKNDKGGVRLEEALFREMENLNVCEIQLL
ncbi:MAG: DNA polymerase III subunit alpha, partial [Bacteroidia bacterium]|nr:DNA polymerase III subunit alpha [Bacteroidia bacterium]